MSCADAPPHYSLDGPLQSTRGHFNAESAALGKNFDWLHLCRCATSRRVSTVTFIPYTAKDACAPFYSLLGPLVVLQDTVPAQISSAIMSTFLQMMHEDPPAPVAITRGILTPSKKNESRWQAHMASIQRGVMLTSADPILEKLSEEASVDELRAAAPQVAHVLSATLPKLPALLKKDAELRAVAVRNLKRLATPQRVRAMMTNAALGKVWRAVAAFRRHDEQVAILCDAFSAAVQGDAEMHAWVESTYNMQARTFPFPLFAFVVVPPAGFRPSSMITISMLSPKLKPANSQFLYIYSNTWFALKALEHR